MLHLVATALTVALQPSPTPATPAAPAQPAEPLQAWEPPAEPPPPASQPTPPDAPYDAADLAFELPDTPAEGPPEVELPEQLTHRKLVVGNMFSVAFGIDDPVPSANYGLFLGTNLRPRRSRRGFDWNTALGYQLSVSLGAADVGSLDRSAVDFDAVGVFIHRHHLTAMGYGGKRQRLFYSFGGGGFFALAQIVGIEAEGRLGYVFGGVDRRAKGVVGGQARLSLAFEGVPLPQFGPFIGVMAF